MSMAGHTNPALIINDEPSQPVTQKDKPNNSNSASETSTVRLEDEPDSIITETISVAVNWFNLNTYASKKSLAQGMLDLALLAANASQLKYILTIGESHEFYGLLLTLVITSICLQVIQAVVCVVLGLVLDINKVDQQQSAHYINNIGLSIVIVVVVINVIISAFDIKAIEGRREIGDFINMTTIAPNFDD